MIRFNNPSSAADYFSHTAIQNCDIAATGDSFSFSYWAKWSSGDLGSTKGEYVWHSQSAASDYWGSRGNDDSGSIPQGIGGQLENDNATPTTTDLNDDVPRFVHCALDTSGTDTFYVRFAAPGDTAMTEGTDTSVTGAAVTQKAGYIGRYYTGSDWHMEGACGEFLVLYDSSGGGALLSEEQVVAIANGAHYFEVVDMSLSVFYWPCYGDTGGDQVDLMQALALTRTSAGNMADAEHAPMTLPYMTYAVTTPAAAPAGGNRIFLPLMGVS